MGKNKIGVGRSMFSLSNSKVAPILQEKNAKFELGHKKKF